MHLAHVIRLHQAFSTDRTEVAPGSNVVGEHFQTDCAHEANIGLSSRRCDIFLARGARDCLEQRAMPVAAPAEGAPLAKAAAVCFAENLRVAELYHP